MHLYLIRHGMASHNLQAVTVPAESVPQGGAYPAHGLTQDGALTVPSGKGTLPLPDPEAVYRAEKLGDSLLTPQGRIQVSLAGRRLSGVRFDAILSSPLQRALSTAGAVARCQAHPPVIECLPDLMEIGCFGRAWMPDSSLMRIYGNVLPCGETQPTGAPAELPEPTGPEDFRARAERVRDYLLARFRGDENVLIASHGGFMSRFLLPVLMNLPPETDTQLCAENAALTKLVVGEGKRTIAAYINEDAYLGKYRSRDPLALDWENIEGATVPLPEAELDFGLIV